MSKFVNLIKRLHNEDRIVEAQALQDFLFIHRTHTNVRVTERSDSTLLHFSCGQCGIIDQVIYP